MRGTHDSVWPLKPLKYLCADPIRNGVGAAAEHDDPTWPRYIRITDIGGPRELRPDSFKSLPPTVAAAAPVKKGDLLLAAVGATVGKSYYHYRDIGPACYAGYLVRVSPMTTVDGRFLAYWSESTHYWNQIRAGLVQATIENFSASKYRSLLAPSPPQSEQRAIADFLDRKTAAIDGLIAKKERLIELLEEKRQTLITQAVTKGLDPNVPMKDSGIDWLGPIPAHWDLQRNKVFLAEAKQRSATGDEELLTVSHITGVTPRSEKQVYMTMAESHEGYKLCAAADVVINTMWAWMGGAGVAPVAGMVSPAYNVYSLDVAVMHPAYYDLILRMPHHVWEMGRRSKRIWTSRLRLYPPEYLDIRTPVPPQAEQRAIADRVEEVSSGDRRMQDVMLRSIERLREYRQALITAAVTGKIDVTRDEVAEIPESEG